MKERKLIAIDTSKHVFTLHGVNERGEVALRRELRRQQGEGNSHEYRRGNPAPEEA